MAQRSRKPFKLGLDPAAYNPTGLKIYSDEELMGEYARLRREATERLRKLGQGEFRSSRSYQENKDRFVKVKDIDNRRQLERLVQDAARFVTAKGSSASGLRAIRREAIQSLHQSGYGWVNTKNYNDFVEFMTWLRGNAAEYATFYESLRSTGTVGAGKLDRSEKIKRREMFEDWLANRDGDDWMDEDEEDWEE